MGMKHADGQPEAREGRHWWADLRRWYELYLGGLRLSAGEMLLYLDCHLRVITHTFLHCCSGRRLTGLAFRSFAPVFGLVRWLTVCRIHPLLHCVCVCVLRIVYTHFTMHVNSSGCHLFWLINYVMWLSCDWINLARARNAKYWEKKLGTRKPTRCQYILQCLLRRERRDLAWINNIGLLLLVSYIQQLIRLSH